MCNIYNTDDPHNYYDAFMDLLYDSFFVFCYLGFNLMGVKTQTAVIIHRYDKSVNLVLFRNSALQISTNAYEFPLCWVCSLLAGRDPLRGANFMCCSISRNLTEGMMTRERDPEQTVVS